MAKKNKKSNKASNKCALGVKAERLPKLARKQLKALKKADRSELINKVAVVAAGLLALAYLSGKL